MINSSPDVESHRLAADGAFPNNRQLPLLVYRNAFDSAGQDTADDVQQRFESNQWGGTWQNGIFDYHHYHSNTHEVLAICAGSGRVQFGGPHGPTVNVAAGDVALLPAGTAHKKIEASSDFLVVGGYPAGLEDYDLIRDEPSKRDVAEQRIAAVPLPERDPLFGSEGPLFEQWQK